MKNFSKEIIILEKLTYLTKNCKIKWNTKWGFKLIDNNESGDDNHESSKILCVRGISKTTIGSLTYILTQQIHGINTNLSFEIHQCYSPVITFPQGEPGTFYFYQIEKLANAIYNNPKPPITLDDVIDQLHCL